MLLWRGAAVLRKLYCEKGLTVLEILLAAALIGLLAAGVFPLLLFGARVYDQGTGQADLQRDMRYAVDFITAEVRFATFIRVLQDPDTVQPLDDYDPVLDVVPESPAAVIGNNNYIYLGGAGGRSLVHLNARGETILTADVITSLVFSSQHRKFRFIIAASEGNRDYAVDTTVLLLNFVPPDSGLNRIPAIRYIKP